MKKVFSRTMLLLGGITLLGLLLRLINIGVETYWGDEILSLDIVRHFTSARDMIAYLAAVEFHPPLYYLLLRPWTDLFGTTEAATRSLSLLFSLATVPLTYVFGERLFRNKRAALIAALVVAVLPMSIEYAQEARPYAIFCFFDVLAAYSAWMFVRERKKPFVFVYIAASAIGISLHYSSFFSLFAISTWWFFEALTSKSEERRMAFIYWLLAHAAVFLAYYPWLSTMVFRVILSKMTYFGIAPRSFVLRPDDIFFHLVHEVVWMRKLKSASGLELLGEFVFLMTFLLLSISPRTGGVTTTDGLPRDHVPALRYLVWVSTVTAIVFSFSPQAYPYTPIYERHAIFLTVPLALIFAYCCCRLAPKRSAVVVALLLVSLIPTVSLVIGDDSQWDFDYALGGIGSYIDENYKSGDLVVAMAPVFRVTLGHYLTPTIPIADMTPFNFYGNDMLAAHDLQGQIESEASAHAVEPTEAALRLKLDRLVQLQNPKRIWLFPKIAENDLVQRWFKDHHWRHVYSAVGDTFPVDLYQRP